jgi:hypothetical protein
MPTQEDVRRLALALPEAVEQPHFDRTSFRIRGRIFATMRGAEPVVNLALPPDLAASVLETEGEPARPISWGKLRGWISLDLQAARPGLLEQLIPAAWSRAAPPALLRETASQ